MSSNAFKNDGGNAQTFNSPRVDCGPLLSPPPLLHDTGLRLIQWSRSDDCRRCDLPPSILSLSSASKDTAPAALAAASDNLMAMQPRFSPIAFESGVCMGVDKICLQDDNHNPQEDAAEEAEDLDPDPAPFIPAAVAELRNGPCFDEEDDLELAFINASSLRIHGIGDDDDDEPSNGDHRAPSGTYAPLPVTLSFRRSGRYHAMCFSRPNSYPSPPPQIPDLVDFSGGRFAPIPRSSPYREDEE